MDELFAFLNSQPTFSIIAVLEATLFNQSNLDLLQKTHRVNGILLMPTNMIKAMNSPDVTYPNKAYGLYPSSSYEWNPNGTGLSYVNFDYPIFRLDNNQVELIENATRTNKDSGYKFPLNGLEMSAFMWAAHDSQTCLRRGFCDPLGGQSVYSSLQTLLPEERKKTILVTSTLDSSAFFHEDALGGDAFTTSVVAALAVADALNRSNLLSYKKNVIFSFFNAEAWGFSGSKKFVHDLNAFGCIKIDANDPFTCLDPKQSIIALHNLSFASLEYIIDFNQVAGLHYPSSDGTLFLHMDNQPNEQSSYLAHIFFEIAKNSSAETNFMKNAVPDPTSGPGLPPGSLMTFLAANRSIAGIMISDFKDKFANPYFFSAYDNSVNIDLDRTTRVICQLSDIAAKTIYLLATESTLDPMPLFNFGSNCTLVSLVQGNRYHRTNFLRF